MPINATELRAALAPSVKLYASIAGLATMLDDVIAEEQRLQGLRREKADLDKAIADLKTQREQLNGELAGITSRITAGKSDVKSAESDLAEKRRQLGLAEVEHTTKLAAIESGHRATLSNEKAAQKKALDQLTADRDGVMAELNAARTQLAEFHERLTSLKKK